MIINQGAHHQRSISVDSAFVTKQNNDFKDFTDDTTVALKKNTNNNNGNNSNNNFGSPVCRYFASGFCNRGRSL